MSTYPLPFQDHVHDCGGHVHRGGRGDHDGGDHALQSIRFYKVIKRD